MKVWYKSKTFWVGKLEIVIGILGLVATWLEAGEFTAPSAVLLVSGCLTIILRHLTAGGLSIRQE